MLKELTNIQIGGISYQNKLNIMRELLGGKATSRKEVAEKCALSEVTVGKVSSALCEQGLLRAEKRPVGRGRHTDFFSPSDILCALVISVREESLSAALFDLSARTIFEVCRSLSPSLPYEASANDFCSELCHHISRTSRKRFFKTAVLFGDCVPSQTREIFKKSIGEHFAIDALLEYESARAHSLCRLHPSGVLLAVGVRERISLSIICAQRTLPKSKYNSIRTPSNAPDMLIEQISALVCPVFEALLPDRIIIESQTVLADRSFCESLRESVARRTNIPKEELPAIESSHYADCAELEALEIIREQICITLAGNES